MCIYMYWHSSFEVDWEITRTPDTLSLLTALESSSLSTYQPEQILSNKKGQKVKEGAWCVINL